MDIYTELVKQSYETGELGLVLRCDPKYIYDANSKYIYSASPEMLNMKIDEIDPISFAKLIDGIKLYIFSLKNQNERSSFEKDIINNICEMVKSDNISDVYFAIKITYVMYIQQLEDAVPKYYVLNNVIKEVLETVIDSAHKNSNLLSRAHIYGGRYIKDGLYGYIKNTLDVNLAAKGGKCFLEHDK